MQIIKFRVGKDMAITHIDELSAAELKELMQSRIDSQKSLPIKMTPYHIRQQKIKEKLIEARELVEYELKKAKDNERRRRYVEKNKEIIYKRNNEYAVKYRTTEKSKATKRLWEAENREHRKEYHKQYYLNRKVVSGHET